MAQRKLAPSPHDLFFRLLFRHRDVAKDFVINFLPAHVSAELDLDFFLTWSPIPTSAKT